MHRIPYAIDEYGMPSKSTAIRQLDTLPLPFLEFINNDAFYRQYLFQC